MPNSGTTNRRDQKAKVQAGLHDLRKRQGQRIISEIKNTNEPSVVLDHERYELS